MEKEISLASFSVNSPLTLQCRIAFSHGIYIVERWNRERFATNLKFNRLPKRARREIFMNFSLNKRRRKQKERTKSRKNFSFRRKEKKNKREKEKGKKILIKKKKTNYTYFSWHFAAFWWAGHRIHVKFIYRLK